MDYDDYRRYGEGRHERQGERTRRIDPKGYVRSDERIRENVCDALSTCGIDVSDVAVHVENGHVTLEGSVSDRQMKYRIEDIVDDCGGVKDISNNLGIARAAGGGRNDAGRLAQGSGMSGAMGEGVSGSGTVSVGGSGETFGSGQVHGTRERRSS